MDCCRSHHQRPSKNRSIFCFFFAFIHNRQIVDTVGLICGHENLVQMCRIVKDSNVTEKLSSAGNWTVFAFTNDAFKLLGQERNITEEAERKILEFHIYENNTLYMHGLICTDRITMYNGLKTRTVCRKGEKYQKGGGNSEPIPFNTSDVRATNGVVHILDGVLLDQKIGPELWPISIVD